jgi:hypothetical protein
MQFGARSEGKLSFESAAWLASYPKQSKFNHGSLSNKLGFPFIFPVIDVSNLMLRRLYPWSQLPRDLDARKSWLLHFFWFVHFLRPAFFQNNKIVSVAYKLHCFWQWLRNCAPRWRNLNTGLT